jgi:hypothetical protein
MPTVSTLTVRLSANSAKLVAEFSKAQRRAKTFSDKMKSTLAGVGRIFAKLGGAAALSLTALAVAGIKAGDNLAKTSQKLGITSEALAGLRFAAEQTGAGVKTLDLGLQRMVRRVAEAAQGTGEAQKAIKELGLDARELARQSPDEQFKRIADAFENVATQSDKVRLGFKLFDSEGVALVNTLVRGRAELERFTEEARSFGLTLTGRQLQNIEAAADAQNRVAKAFSGLGRQLGATFAPAMEAASNATASLVARLTQSIPKLTAVAAGIFGINREVERLSSNELKAELENVFRLLGNAVDARDDAQEQLNRGIGSGFIPGRQSRQDLEAAEADIERLSNRYNELKSALANVKEEQKQVNVLFGEGSGATREQKDRVKALALAWKESQESLLSYIAAQDALKATGESIFAQTRTDVERFNSAMKEAREALDAGLLRGGQDTFDRFNRQLSAGLIPTLEKVKDKSQELRFDFTSAFEEAIVQGNNFRDVLKGILQDIIRILARKTITEPLSNAFSSLIGNLFGGARALGGPVSAGKSFLVGERGPELFIPSQSGSIVANNKLRGGINISNTFNIEAGVDLVTLEKILPPVLDRNREQTKAELLQMRLEGAF